MEELVQKVQQKQLESHFSSSSNVNPQIDQFIEDFKKENFNGENGVHVIDSLTAVKLSSLLLDKLNVKVPPAFLLTDHSKSSKDSENSNHNQIKDNSVSQSIHNLDELSNSFDILRFSFDR